MEVCRSLNSKEMNEMDKTQMTTIMYLTASAAIFLISILEENPVLCPFGLVFLILGAYHYRAEDEKIC